MRGSMRLVACAANRVPEFCDSASSHPYCVVQQQCWCSAFGSITCVRLCIVFRTSLFALRRGSTFRAFSSRGCKFTGSQIQVWYMTGIDRVVQHHRQCRTSVGIAECASAAIQGPKVWLGSDSDQMLQFRRVRAVLCMDGTDPCELARRR